MKRSKKLIVLIAVLVILVVAVTIITKLTAPEPYSAEDNSIPLSIPAETVTNLAWDFGGESLSLSSDGETWSYDGDPEFPLDQSYPEAMLSALEKLSASQMLESPAALSEYGLDVPSLTVSVTANGAKTVFYIGNQNAVTSEYYLTIGSDGAVYMIDSTLAAAFSKGLYDIVQLEGFSSITSVDRMTIYNGDEVLEIYSEEDPADAAALLWFAVGEDGTSIALDAGQANTLVNYSRGFTWDSCINYHATAEELEAYGFDGTARITMEYTATAEDGTESAGVVDLLFGKAVDEELRYAKLADSDMVYVASATKISDMLGATLDSLLPDAQ
jgi:hypothetical protein